MKSSTKKAVEISTQVRLQKQRDKWIGYVKKNKWWYVATVIDYEDSEHVTININGNTYVSKIRSLNKKAVKKLS